jgi:hypothetical protein
MRGIFLTVLASVLVILCLDKAGAGPRVFTVWDSKTAQWTNPNADDLAEDTRSPSLQPSTTNILPNYRASRDAKLAQPPPRPLTVLVQNRPASVLRAGPQYSVRPRR